MPRNKGWFRVYDRMLDSPDILELNDSEFRVIISIWCLASQSGSEDGRIAYKNGALWRRVAPQIKREVFESILTRLQEVGLLLGKDGEYFVKEWARHQYLYDSKKPSVRKLNEKRTSSDGEVFGKSSGSLREVDGKQDSDTDSETETDTEGTKGDSRFKPLLDLLHDMPIQAYETDEDALKAVARFSLLFPLVDIAFELNKMQGWLKGVPPSKHPKVFHLFAMNWLRREQQKANATAPKEEPEQPEFQQVGEWK